MRTFIILLSAVMICFAGQLQGAGDIVAGPMVGHVSERSARIWLQLSVAKQVTITCVEDRGDSAGEVGIDVEGPIPFTCDVPLTNLKPNKNYRIEVKLDGKPVPQASQDVIIRTAPPPGDEAAFGIAFSSGLAVKGRGSQPTFKTIETLQPRAFLFLGNSLTLPSKVEDYPKTHRAAVRAIAATYSEARQEPDLQQLLRTTACYAVWNDRDFGTPDSNKDWVFKEESWDAFRRFWPNPDWGSPDNPGCYFNFTIGDADFFMLDSRMYRDPESDPARKTMLGATQLAWLKNGLKQSKATFKIIGCGSQLLADYGQGDTWAAYPEQKEFLKWIADNGITGVVFVTGAKRGGEVTAVKPAPGEKGYTLFELSTTGAVDKELPNPARQGPFLTGNQFGTLDFGGQREHRFMTLKLRDQDGKVKAEQTLFATQLK